MNEQHPGNGDWPSHRMWVVTTLDDIRARLNRLEEDVARQQVRLAAIVAVASAFGWALSQVVSAWAGFGR